MVSFLLLPGIAGKIFILIWFGGGLLTFLIGKPGWHIGASGLIYGLCLLSLFQWYSPQICSTHCHLFTCHLLYGGNYMAYVSLFLPTNMSWEGHLSGGIMGTLCAFVFVNHGPQRRNLFRKKRGGKKKKGGKKNPRGKKKNKNVY